MGAMDLAERLRPLADLVAILEAPDAPWTSARRKWTQTN
jgi:hypothetical protein